MQNQRLRKAAALTREWTPDGPHGVRNDDLALAREPQARSTLSFASPGPRPPLPPASRDSETSARLREPRQQVLELRQLHLEVAVARGRMLREDVEDGLRAVYARGRARRPDRVGKPLAHAQGRRVAVPQAGVGVRVHVKGDVQPDSDSRVGGPGRPPTARSPRSGASPCDYVVEPARATWSDATPAGARRGRPRRGARRGPPLVVELGAGGDAAPSRPRSPPASAAGRDMR